MTTSPQKPDISSHKAQLELLLKSICDLFDSVSEDRQRKLLSSLEQLARHDRRKDTRTLCLIPVTVNAAYSGIARNISVRGAFIRTSAPVSVGQEITMDFPLPESDEPTKMIGEVVWRNAVGFGVQFTLPPSQKFQAVINKTGSHVIR